MRAFEAIRKVLPALTSVSAVLMIFCGSVSGCDRPTDTSASPSAATQTDRHEIHEKEPPVDAPAAPPAQEQRNQPAPSDEPGTTGEPESPPPPDTVPPAPPSTSASAGSSSAAAEVVANPNLKGRLGRIVIAYPESAVAKGTHVQVFKPGEPKPVQEWYGPRTIELLPGSFDVAVCKKKLPGLSVVARSDTRVRLGVLQINADKATLIKVLDADGATELFSGYGTQLVGLPVGDYFVEIVGQKEKVMIEDGKVTEF